VASAAYRAVDDEMRDMDALRPELARGALGEAAQGELAHGEGRRQREALDAGGGAGQQDGAAAMRQHAFHRLLRHQEGAVGGDRERLRHRGRIKLGDRSAQPAAGIVDDDVGLADLGVRRLEQAGDGGRIGGIDLEGRGANLGRECGELFGVAGGEADLDALRRERTRNRGADAGAGADDQGAAIGQGGHRGVSVQAVAGIGLGSPPRIMMQKPAAKRQSAPAMKKAGR
jgi:hypothetical protein